ncbi:MAG: DUF962 domain-containing protein [Verrucomicrobia bacterium]|nr:DUF962 domain-containing protein [Verrucomicrobiota bacterium]
MSKKPADQWFAEYGESHQHATNELIHWICVPTIFFCVLGFIWSIPTGATLAARLPWFDWSLVAIAVAAGFYVRLSWSLAIGLLGFMAACRLGLSVLGERAPWPVWQVCLVLFVVAWIGQFIGHHVEGKKPSFFQDLAFLLIGPAWLLSHVYRKLGLRY